MQGDGIRVVGVLETGRPPEDLAPAFGDYPGMVGDWLAPLGAGIRPFAVLDGEFPASPAECDLWVITGSRFGVYEGHDWIAPLEEFIRICHDSKRPMVGICFGHQIIAQALGGVVRKSAKGWGIGVHDYTPVNWPAALGRAPERIALQSWHQDQIEDLPDAAWRIATSEFCENAALWYPGFALTFQGHPEFPADYVRALIDLRRGVSISEADAETGIANLGRSANPEVLPDLIAAAFAG